jgi:phage tail-like protein
MMADEPFGSFRFAVEIDGMTFSKFREVHGLSSAVDVVEYSDGTGSGFAQKIPGRTKFSNITLKWAMTDDLTLYEWHAKILDGQIDRRMMLITLSDSTGAAITRWEIKNAWPCKYEAPDLNAESSDVAIEAMEFAHTGLRRTK